MCDDQTTCGRKAAKQRKANAMDIINAMSIINSIKKNLTERAHECLVSKYDYSVDDDMPELAIEMHDNDIITASTIMNGVHVTLAVCFLNYK